MKRRDFIRAGSWGLLGLGACMAFGRSARGAKVRGLNPGDDVAVQDDPGLPRVLLIGDSISMDYEDPTRNLLKGKANVHHNPGNGGNSRFGLQNLDPWLGDGKWNVIHFNWGLHDIGRNSVWPSLTGAYQVPLEEYESNLRKVVERLKGTGATLIWASTTPVPDKIANVKANRRNSDVVAYNAAARKIMEEQQIAIDDLYAFALPRLKEIQLPDNVHFKVEGSQELATQVAASILAVMNQRH